MVGKKPLIIKIQKILMLFVCLPLAGCMADQLRFTASRLPATLPDISQNQVLNNLARTAADPTRIPFFALVTDGVADVLDTGTFDTTFEGVVKQYTTNSFSPGGSRAVQGNWTLKPTTNPDRLLAMRGAYHIALGLPLTRDEEEQIVRFLGVSGVSQIPADFACSGERQDVPKRDAVYIVCSGNTYVWVMPEKTEALSQFILVIYRLYINKIGGLEQNEIAPTGDPQPNPFSTRPNTPLSAPALPSRVPSSDYPPNTLNQGLFFVPR